MKTKERQFCFLLLFCLCVVLFLPCHTKAAVKLNRNTLTLCRYHSTTLKITGTKQSVKWKSADKSVATVSKKGKVTGVTDGKTKITATVGKKKYTCNVTVKDYGHETELAAYGLETLKKILKDPNSLTIKHVWLGSTPANVPFGMLDCTFKDNSGKKVHAYVYTYEQEQPSSSCFNTTTNFYENGLVVKLDALEMDSIQQSRVTKGSVSALKKANQYIFDHEKISVTKGIYFDSLNTWIKL